jgi:hypothetical protein
VRLGVCFSLSPDQEIRFVVPLSKLCEEHRWLEAEAAKLLRIVSLPMPDTAAITAIRWRIAQALRDHCRREGSAVYDWLLDSGDAAGEATARRYRRDHGDVDEAFSRYVANWPISRLSREWDDFRIETEVMVTELAARTLLEEQVLYPHVERVQARRDAA